MKKILVSACLLGDACRYDGKSLPNQDIQKILNIVDVVPFCPEVEGGLPTPRKPSEIKKGNVYNQEGKNVTSYFEAGAKKALELCKYLGIEIAILKDKSPSCGSLQIHSGYFDERVVKGEGWTTSLLRKNGIQVFSEQEIDKVISLLQHEEDERAKQKEESRIRREQKQAEKESSEVEQLKEEKAKLEEELDAKEKSHFARRRFPPKTDKGHSFGRRSFSSRPRFNKEDQPSGENASRSEESEEKKSFHRSSRPFSPRRRQNDFSRRPPRRFKKEGEATSSQGGEEKRSFRPKRSSFHRSRSSFQKGFSKPYRKSSSFKGKKTHQQKDDKAAE